MPVDSNRPYDPNHPLDPNTLGKALLTKSGTLLVDDKGNNIMLPNEPSGERVVSGYLPRDTEWIRHSFITYQGREPGNVGGVVLGAQDAFNSRFSSAALKYTDTSPGGNKFINPPPQFTRYADIRAMRPRFPGQRPDLYPQVTTRKPDGYSSYGLGRFYSEAIDDNAQVIHMRFGVASFNSLMSFFLNFYSTDMAALARGARYTDDFVTRWSTRVGNVLGIAVAPLFLLPHLILFVGQVARYFTNSPSSKFYTLKPSMHTYWMAVNSIINQMATNSGISSFVDTNQSKHQLKGGYGAQELTNSKLPNFVSEFLPKGMLSENGQLDVYAIANRTNRLEVEFQQRMSDAFKAASPNDSWHDVVRKSILSNNSTNFNPDRMTSIEEYMARFIKFVGNKVTGKGDAMEKDPRQAGLSEDGKTYDSSKVAAENPGFFDFLMANANDGSEWVSYRVDYTGQVQESFSSSTQQLGIADKVNSMSRQARDMRYNFADGNVGGGLGTVVDMAKGVVSGIAEVVHLDGLAAAAGSAFVDIPEAWNESVAKLSTATYNITLISPYGNPVSILFNIWLPLATLLAGALPLATGKQSHTSPFLVELHDRGRAMTRLGIIDSMSISRGTSNLGFNREGQALAIEVTFGVKDLSSVIAVPIHSGFNVFNPLEGLFDGDNAFNDYLMTLAGTTLGDTGVNKIPLLKYQVNRKIADVSTFFSSSRIASWMTGMPGVGLLGAVMRGTDRK